VVYRGYKKTRAVHGFLEFNWYWFRHSHPVRIMR